MWALSCRVAVIYFCIYDSYKEICGFCSVIAFNVLRNENVFSRAYAILQNSHALMTSKSLLMWTPKRHFLRYVHFIRLKNEAVAGTFGILNQNLRYFGFFLAKMY